MLRLLAGILLSLVATTGMAQTNVLKGQVAANPAKRAAAPVPNAGAVALAISFRGPDVVAPKSMNGASDLICGTLNAPLVQSGSGSTFDFVTGMVGTYSATRVDDINLYDYGSGMTVYWYGDVATLSVGGVIDGGGEFAVLPAGTTIGPGSTFSPSSKLMTNWLGGADGYVGVAFENESTSSLNYGWLHLTTTASLGYPATLVDYCYDPTGDAVVAGYTGGPVPPSVTKSFTPAQIVAGDTSTVTITLDNSSQSTAAVLSSAFDDALPSGVVLAAAPNAATTCGSGAVTAAPGGNTITLAAGATIPAGGTCTISADVMASANGTYVNTIPAGELVTQHGSNSGDATATLKVGFTFPEPYCPVDFTSTVEPITRVVFANIDNTSDATIGGSPALEDFTSIIGNVDPGDSVAVATEGNTNGSWNNTFVAFIDWDQSGTFDASELFPIGTITNSTGTDGQQATTTLSVPASAAMGQTRMRIIKMFGTTGATDACSGGFWGQAEDYTLQVGAVVVTHTVTTSVTPAGGGSISPPGPLTVNDGDVVSFTVTPAAGFNVQSVGSTCGGTFNAATSTYTTDPVTTDCSVDAVFQAAGGGSPGGPSAFVPVPANNWQALLLLMLSLMLGGAFVRWRQL